MLRTENISFSVGKKQILKNVSASFLPGEFNMILGPNGSGKSSFLKIFSGEINRFILLLIRIKKILRSATR